MSGLKRCHSLSLCGLMSAVHVESAVLNFARVGCPLWDLDVLSFLPDQALQGRFHLSVINNSSGRLARQWGAELVPPIYFVP